MSLPPPAAIFAALDATWPAERVHRLGPLALRSAPGAGSRVNAASAEGPVDAAALAAAEAEMAAQGRPPLFMVRGGEDGFDALLAARGYAVKDPVHAYAAPLDALHGPPPPVTALETWPPLAIQREIWAAGGIGPARLAVMGRAAGPKVAILGRTRERAAGTAYVAIHDGLAMLHALEVAPAARRHGLGRAMMAGAADWARRNGAAHLTLLVTRANVAANALYAGLGMQVVTSYHYRIKEEP